MFCMWSDRAELNASKIGIRRATPRDARAIGSVFDAAVRAEWTYLGELAQKPMFTSKDWTQMVSDHAPPNVLLVAADKDGGIIGYAAAHPKDCEMYLLFVRPDYAGRGIGRSLLNAVHDALGAAGCSHAYLFTHEQNTRALAVYASAGYRRDGSIRESDFRGVPIRELRLVKPL